MTNNNWFNEIVDINSSDFSLFVCIDLEKEKSLDFLSIEHFKKCSCPCSQTIKIS